MKVFIFGISGAVGRLLAEELAGRGDDVLGLVRREEQREDLAARGLEALVGQLTELSADSLVPLLKGCDVVVYAAGSNGGPRQVTAAVDGEGVDKALEATRMAGVVRFVLLSVLPEAGRGECHDSDVEFYFAVKKLVDVTVSLSGLDWVILRPSLLLDRSGTGTVALGPAQPHDEISRADVAATLAELLHEPRIRQRILELNQGLTPIDQAVRENLS